MPLFTRLTNKNLKFVSSSKKVLTYSSREKQEGPGGQTAGSAKTSMAPESNRWKVPPSVLLKTGEME
jgi:hypothetical protein